MKETTLVNYSKCVLHRILVTVYCLFFVIVASAQDAKKVDVNISSDSGGSGGTPWVWIIGIAVFVLLLVALLARRREA
jgi:hypothetical protein